MRTKTFVALHILLLIYSSSEIFSKLAGNSPFLSLPFCLYYGIVLLILFLYAIGWQQIIKEMPLTTAYSNKAITTIWGTVWGITIFHERFSVGKFFGIVLIVAGILLFVREDHQTDG